MRQKFMDSPLKKKMFFWLHSWLYVKVIVIKKPWNFWFKIIHAYRWTLTRRIKILIPTRVLPFDYFFFLLSNPRHSLAVSKKLFSLWKHFFLYFTCFKMIEWTFQCFSLLQKKMKYCFKTFQRLPKSYVMNTFKKVHKNEST